MCITASLEDPCTQKDPTLQFSPVHKGKINVFKTPHQGAAEGRTPHCFVFHQTVFAIENKTRHRRVRSLYELYDSMQIQ